MNNLVIKSMGAVDGTCVGYGLVGEGDRSMGSRDEPVLDS